MSHQATEPRATAELPPRGAATSRIDDAELVRLLIAERRTITEAARHFGVTHQAISKRVRLLGLRRPSHVLAHVEAAQRGAFDIAERLTQLDALLQAEISRLRTNGGGVRSDQQRFDRLVTLVAESRKTCATAIELTRALAAVQQIGEFRERVIRALDVLPDEWRARVLDQLRADRRARVALTPITLDSRAAPADDAPPDDGAGPES